MVSQRGSWVSRDGWTYRVSPELAQPGGPLAQALLTQRLTIFLPRYEVGGGGVLVAVAFLDRPGEVRLRRLPDRKLDARLARSGQREAHVLEREPDVKLAA
jgi:hypothetical protein